MTNLAQLVRGVALAICIVTGIFLVSILPQGSRDIGAITNIHGVPFPVVDGESTVTQSLGHIDIQLREPVVFKSLELSFTYRPADVKTLSVGVRENDFWLSYTPTVFYETGNVSNEAVRSATVVIPLTDKLQEPDRSIDVMFIANSQTETSLQDEVRDPTLWYIKDVRAQVIYHQPSVAILKDYVRAILYRERPL